MPSLQASHSPVPAKIFEPIEAAFEKADSGIAAVRARVQEVETIFQRAHTWVSERKALGERGAAARLEKLEEAGQKYRKAWELRLRGVSVGKINAQLGVGACQNWFEGAIPRTFLNNDPQHIRALEKEVRMPTQPSAALAAILGAYAGRSGEGYTPSRLEMSCRTKQLPEELKAAVLEVFGVEGSVGRYRASQPKRHGSHGSSRTPIGKYYCFHVGHQQIVRFIFDTTNGNRRVPFEWLPNSELRRTYLQFFFKAGGGAINAQRHMVQASKVNNASLIEEIGVVFKREGVLPLVTKAGSERAQLVIRDQNDLARLNEIGVFPRLEDVERLKAACSVPLKRRALTVAEYQTAMPIIRENRNRSSGQIALLIKEQSRGAVDLESFNIRAWMKGWRPDSMRRLERLEIIEERIFGSKQSAEMRTRCGKRIASATVPLQVMESMRELAWLRGFSEDEIPRGVPLLNDYRKLFHQLKVPFTAHHEAGWREAARNRSSITEHSDPALVLGALRNYLFAKGRALDDVPELVLSVEHFRNVLAQYGVTLSEVNRRGFMKSEMRIQALKQRISEARPTGEAIALIRELSEARGRHGDFPAPDSSFLRYFAMFKWSEQWFSARHECGWHESINKSPALRSVSPLARGVLNLIYRRWESPDHWRRELPRIPGSRYGRIVDAIVGEDAVAVKDVVDLLQHLGVKRNSDQARYLVALSIAPEDKALAHLASVPGAVRATLADCYKAEGGPESDFDDAVCGIYTFLPGVKLSRVQDDGAIKRAVHGAPYVGAVAEVNEESVAALLGAAGSHTRVKQIAAAAAAAQTVGLDPHWVVEMMK